MVDDSVVYTKGTTKTRWLLDGRCVHNTQHHITSLKKDEPKTRQDEVKRRWEIFNLNLFTQNPFNRFQYKTKNLDIYFVT